MPIRKAEAKSASDAASSGGVIEELRRRYDRLTQSQKRIAEYIVEHSQAVAFSTVDQMAAQLDVNPSTIVRFTYRLGLNGFPDLQERMRELVRGQLSRTGDPINEGQVAGHLELLPQLPAALDLDELEAGVERQLPRRHRQAFHHQARQLEIHHDAEQVHRAHA